MDRIAEDLRLFRDDGDFSRLPDRSRMCPSCNEMRLEFNKKLGVIRCSNCGFEAKIPLI